MSEERDAVAEFDELVALIGMSKVTDMFESSLVAFLDTSPETWSGGGNLANHGRAIAIRGC